MTDIVIEGAREGNLKNISLRIPRNSFTVLAGVSGSGKSTLAVDVLFNECQRQYLEAIGMQGIRKPDVDRVRGACPAILISQRTAVNRNPRSTVGTSTEVYTELRMLFEKLGVRRCPFCGEPISAADCREETEKRDGDFFVHMYCCKCGKRMDKLTRTDFSHNTREGACPTCQGLGKVLAVDEGAALREELSLEDGAVDFWEGKYREYQIGIFYKALDHYGAPLAPGRLVRDFSSGQRAILLYGTESGEARAAFPEVTPPKNAAGGRFEGAFSTLWRRLGEKDGDTGGRKQYFKEAPCGDCGGERLCVESRAVTVAGKRLPELAALSLEALDAWLDALEGSLRSNERALVESYLLDLGAKLRRLQNVGLGYLTLDRQAMTLSGGEEQRIKLSATLDSDLTGVLYVLDEPTVGLHPKDTGGILDILKGLRDKGNTVVVIEHDPDVLAAADYVVDLGPGAGKHGGEVLAAGSLEDLKGEPRSVTGAWLTRGGAARRGRKPDFTRPVRIRNASLHNLRQVDAAFPTGCLTAVTGVSGSGKSTLVFDVLAGGGGGKTEGLEQFGQVVTIEQSAITRMRRSNACTYISAWDEIRKRFGDTAEAAALGLTAGDFSFNTKGGRCETCGGLGVVNNNLLFFSDVEVKCPDCGGRRFQERVLSVRWEGKSILDVLDMSVEEALGTFGAIPKLRRSFGLLQDVGLGYLTLGQSLTTLSGGEGQRLKLARELLSGKGKRTLYLMDEPTTGLHPADVEHFLALLDRMADAGSTLIVVEHNQQLIRRADYVVDLGPGGGDKGGELVFAGTPEELKTCPRSETGRYL